jgi:hypothetical protein
MSNKETWCVVLVAVLALLAALADAPDAEVRQRFNVWSIERSGDINFSLVNDGVDGKCYVVTYHARGYGAGASSFGPVSCPR